MKPVWANSARVTTEADFGSEFDRRLAHGGCPAVFTCDADGELPGDLSVVRKLGLLAAGVGVAVVVIVCGIVLHTMASFYSFAPSDAVR